MIDVRMRLTIVLEYSRNRLARLKQEYETKSYDRYDEGQDPNIALDEGEIRGLEKIIEEMESALASMDTAGGK